MISFTGISTASNVFKSVGGCKQTSTALHLWLVWYRVPARLSLTTNIQIGPFPFWKKSRILNDFIFTFFLRFLAAVSSHWLFSVECMLSNHGTGSQLELDHCLVFERPCILHWRVKDGNSSHWWWRRSRENIFQITPPRFLPHLLKSNSGGGLIPDVFRFSEMIEIWNCCAPIQTLPASEAVCRIGATKPIRTFTWISKSLTTVRKVVDLPGGWSCCLSQRDTRD